MSDRFWYWNAVTGAAIYGIWHGVLLAGAIVLTVIFALAPPVLLVMYLRSHISDQLVIPLVAVGILVWVCCIGAALVYAAQRVDSLKEYNRHG